MKQSRVVSLNSQPAGRRGVGRLIGRSAGSDRGYRVSAAAILESLEDAVIARTLDGIICSWSSGAERLYGRPAGRAVGRAYDDILVPSQRRDREAEMVTWAVRAELSDTYETERLQADGTLTAVSVQISPIRNASGQVTGVATMEREVREARHRIAWELESGAHMRSAFYDAPIGTALVGVYQGAEGGLLRVNRAFCELTGYSAEELEQTDVRALLDADDVETDRAMTTRLLDGELDGFQVEQRLLHAGGHALWVMLNATLVRDSAGSPLYCIRQIHDIEERKRFEGELGYLVEHDALTGLLNRRGFVREVTQAMAYARRYGGGGAVLFLDLDDFKSVNDTHGHLAGDEVISEVARVMLHRLRETDVCARIGGDEFAVLLPHTNAEEARVLCGSLLGAVRDRCEAALGEGLRVTMSIGVTTFREPAKDLTADDLLMDADVAMYSAKESGKDRLVMASVATQERMRTRITWAERVRRATAESRFELHGQPIVDLAGERIAQWELLLRLPGDDGELILPAQFLYTAERAGLMLAIDCWVVGEAIRLIAEQQGCGRELQLAVNLASRSLGEPELLRFIEEGLQATGIDPASLVLEVSETAAIANMDRARTFASKLSAIGCRFALDDFGAGFGSFYYLKHIPFDFVKIDGEFIRNLPASPTDQLILDSIVQMSKGLGKHTIAEYVGDRATVTTLKEHGVDYAQGYYLGRPLPVSEALAV
jgi:diguanylate cyclase (GGDEF)-like protein/PAS domain S-box-containing protein